MTPTQRTAASECVRIMALLTEAKTPHAKELALIVGTRLLAIVDNEPGSAPAYGDEVLGPWIQIARSLVDQEERIH